MRRKRNRAAALQWRARVARLTAWRTPALSAVKPRNQGGGLQYDDCPEPRAEGGLMRLVTEDHMVSASSRAASATRDLGTTTAAAQPEVPPSLSSLGMIGRRKPVRYALTVQ